MQKSTLLYENILVRPDIDSAHKIHAPGKNAFVMKKEVLFTCALIPDSTTTGCCVYGLVLLFPFDFFLFLISR